MSAIAPAPSLLSTDGTLWVAYRIARDPGHCAVIRFHHVERYARGAPPAAHAEESLGELSRGSFYEVPAADAGQGRRWIITFPDALLEVRAADGEVVLRAAAALGPSHTLAALLC